MEHGILVVGSCCGKDGTQVPSSDGALDIVPLSLRIGSRLGLNTKDAEAEKGRENLGHGLSQQKHFQSSCLNSPVATRINVPLILCGFLCLESCHFVKAPPFLSLICPSLD